MMNNNLEIKEKFLPIGTVVLLNGGTKRVMILGFYSHAIGKKEIYDYTGCFYPEGLVNSNELFLFNHDQIVNVYHYGYICDDEIDFKNRLKEAIKS